MNEKVKYFCSKCNSNYDAEKILKIKSGTFEATACPNCKGPIFQQDFSDNIKKTSNSKDKDPHPLKLLLTALFNTEIVDDINLRLENNKKYFWHNLLYSYVLLFIPLIFGYVIISKSGNMPPGINSFSFFKYFTSGIILIVTSPIIMLTQTYSIHIAAHLMGQEGAFMELWFSSYILNCSVIFYFSLLFFTGLFFNFPLMFFLLLLVMIILTLSGFNHVIMQTYACNSVLALILYIVSVILMGIINLIFVKLS